jgi:hypothetical protein
MSANVKKVPHEWSKEALLAKAQRYAETMLSHNKEDWQFGFWSALVLEILARAAMSSVSPALVADGKDWNNILYSLGGQPNANKFTPKSAEASAIFSRVAATFPSFKSEMLNFSATHLDRRNSEVHSGALPFDGLGSSNWLPMFYASCEALLEIMGEKLEILFGTDESKIARQLIKAYQDDAAKAVKGVIAAHKTIWDGKGKPEQERLSKQAELLASRDIGHRVSCPACGSQALLLGTPAGSPKVFLDGDIVIEKNPMLPSTFECKACGLKIAGYSKLHACGLGDTYTSTHHYEAADYFGVSVEDEWRGMDDDNNEY